MKLFHFITIIFSCICLFACEKDDRTIINNQHITSPRLLLVAGQSNTYYGDGLNEKLDSPVSNIFQLGRHGKYNYKILLAEEPLEHHTIEKNKIGFVLPFAKKLLKHKSDSNSIIIVPCGLGGTSFIDGRWNKGDDLYTDAIERVIYLQKKFPKSQLTAILWHQGENDLFKNNKNYQNDLDSFIRNIRKDLNDSLVPFILGGMVPYWVDKAKVIQERQLILKATTTRHANVGYADPTIPFVIEKENNDKDIIHYDSKGMRELGRRYFNEYIKLTAQ